MISFKRYLKLKEDESGVTPDPQPSKEKLKGYITREKYTRLKDLWFQYNSGQFESEQEFLNVVSEFGIAFKTAKEFKSYIYAVKNKGRITDHDEDDETSGIEPVAFA